MTATIQNITTCNIIKKFGTEAIFIISLSM